MNMCIKSGLLIFVFICSNFLYANNYSKGGFVLVSDEIQSSIYLDDSAPEFLKLAVQDLIEDVFKITGKKLVIQNKASDCDGNCLIIQILDNKNKKVIGNPKIKGEYKEISGGWEQFKINEIENLPNSLVITGSDERGAMFGVYYFIKNQLKVDPLYFWSGLEPEKKVVLSWASINYTSETPSFKYRGWFINDEDLLTEWKESGGVRNIDYPYYKQVVNPNTMEHVVEALVRSGQNLIIPASFIDILNPAEAKLVEIASKRGVFISQHHVEPLGVSAFSFFNYWKARGEDKLFSYYSSKEALIEVWEAYAKKWAEYPNVIWQLGLRGIADRPMWMADPNVPQSEEDFGRIISEAIKTQLEIVKEIDPRESIPFTTTLWAEGSALFEKGYLEIPQEVMIIFSDNSPGWKFSGDFYELERKPGYQYGIYYHQQLWSSGPHLAPTVHPSKTYKLVSEAVASNSNTYGIVNVSNIREFVLGINATSLMLNDYKNFDLDGYLDEWFEYRYKSSYRDAREVYSAYFDSFETHDIQGTPILMDGQLKSAGLNYLSQIRLYLKDTAEYWRNNTPDPEKKPTVEQSWGRKYLSSMVFEPLAKEQYRNKVDSQRKKIAIAGNLAESALSKMDETTYLQFYQDFMPNYLLIHGLTNWLSNILSAREAIEANNLVDAQNYLIIADTYFNELESAKEIRSQGKWKNWYRGDKKMNLESMKDHMLTTLDMLATQTKN